MQHTLFRKDYIMKTFSEQKKFEEIKKATQVELNCLAKTIKVIN